MAKLVINPTSAAKREIPLLSRVISIGRDPSNDLVLSDSMVSRRHAILEQRDNQFILRDNNSSNGTLVNGDRVDSEKPLRDGDLVAIGSSRLLFQLDDTAEVGIAPAPAPARAESAPAQRPATPAAAPHVPRCASCGMAALASDRFCRSCGKELPRERKIACGHCGSENLLPAEFCGQCGRPLALDRPAAVSSRANRRSELELELDAPGDGAVVSERSPAAAARPRARVSPAKKSASVSASASASAAVSGENASFGVRLLAFLVDEMILGIPLLLGALIWMALSVGGAPSGGTGPSALLGALLSLGYSVVSVLYYVLFWGGRGTTPGKSLLGLVVKTEAGEMPIGYSRALLRLLGYGVSFALLGLGFLPILLSPDRRGLHDRIAGTRVTRSS
jgi:adenylate cyclase